MEGYTASSRLKRKRDFYANSQPVIVPQPKVLVLRYEDASEVHTPYVKWSYNLSSALQGYTAARLLSVQAINNYATARLANLGIKIDELPSNVRHSSSSGVAPSWVVPNFRYDSSAFTEIVYTDEPRWPLLELDNISTSNLTITLYDGVGSQLVASGAPADFFCDIIIEFS